MSDTSKIDVRTYVHVHSPEYMYDVKLKNYRNVRMYDVKTQKLQVRTYVVRGTPVMLQQVTAAEVQPRLAAQVNTAVSLDRTRMVNITFFSHHFLGY